LIGTLKAGGAYVPLEPDQPLRRLGALLDAVAPRAVVSQEKLIERLPQDRRSGALLLDRDERLAAAPTDDPRVEIAPSQLMYVIFTSGSTGVPKGVGVEHRQLANYLRGIRVCLDPPPASFAMVSTFAADLGHTALFPTLASGGCLRIVAVAEATDAAAFAALARREEFAALKIVPSHLEALLTGRDPALSLPARLLVLGGEASRWDLIERIRELRPDLRVINHYGPTETTVGVATHPVSERLPYAATVPLGHPLAGTRFRILDPDLEPVPEGIAGELFVAGLGVARGYLGRPDATAERFVPDPFACEPGARMYRTGDRARYLPDRCVEFLGRIDSQVKFHGFRVELNEIRLATNAHRNVRDSVVLLQRDGQGRDALVCYYVSRQEIEVEDREVNQYYDRFAGSFQQSPQNFSTYLRSIGSSERSMKRQIRG
jgi:amino acid adenylation domain-containing protein